ncbi:MAG: CoA pyrophosphatase [Actinomycetota bacterium]
MTSRGGPQHIPRPADWELGGPPPWSLVTDPDLSLDGVVAALDRRGPGRVVGPGPGPDNRRSAVLVPLYEVGGEAHVVLTRRSANLRSHTHEVSFPGGRIDPEDVDEWDTALREAEEEVALDRSLPERVGELDSFVTGGSMTYVTPLVGRLPERPELSPSEAEVERILHVPLGELLLPEVWREEIWTRAGFTRPITFFELHGDTVWGATGAMLRQLLAIVTGTDETIVREV